MLINYVRYTTVMDIRKYVGTLHKFELFSRVQYKKRTILFYYSAYVHFIISYFISIMNAINVL